jgi:hypothetical protein
VKLETLQAIQVAPGFFNVFGHQAIAVGLGSILSDVGASSKPRAAVHVLNLISRLFQHTRYYWLPLDVVSDNQPMSDDLETSIT